MNEMFDNSSSAAVLVLFLVYLLCGVLPFTGLLFLIYYLFTAPLRRNERARLLLDLLELGMVNGQTPEATVLAAARTSDAALGKGLGQLAKRLEAGLRLTEALDRVPALLPAKTRATLQSGEALGSLLKVVPAARETLRDAVSAVRGAMNYLVVLLFAVTPVTAFIPFCFMVFILPKYREVFSELVGGMPLPAFTRLVFAPNIFLVWFQVGLVLFFWGLALAYILGPKIRPALGSNAHGLLDRFDLAVPWRRKRLQRDFSFMLATFLDADVPEPEALRLAARSTANSVIEKRAARAQNLLAHGSNLPDALRLIDGSSEFQWRLTNALRPGEGFLRALGGWHETLDARAFQLEQAAAQLVTTGLVLLNGVFVGSIVIAVFLVLVSILHHATLW